MSSTSTRFGDAGHAASEGGDSSWWGSVPRDILRDDMCVNRLALFAEPSTNTNFSSRFLAMA